MFFKKAYKMPVFLVADTFFISFPFCTLFFTFSNEVRNGKFCYALFSCPFFSLIFLPCILEYMAKICYVNLEIICKKYYAFL